MTQYNCQTPQQTGKITLSDEPLGRGGEGSVYEVTQHDMKELADAKQLVGKIYHEDKNDPDRLKKIVAMIQKVPDTDSVAWPQALIIDDNNNFKGYVMDKLSYDKYRMWGDIAHSQRRKDSAGKFDVRYAMTASLNLAYTLEAVHEAGHMVGDINESNIFVSNDATVLLVDTDSAQIDRGNGQIFPCLVGKAEYTAPELSHGPLRDQRRTEATDLYGYAIAVYQMMVGGAHPTDGIYTGDDDPISVVERERKGLYPNFKEAEGFKKVPRIPTDAIPKELHDAILISLNPDPIQRGSMEQLSNAMENVLDNITQCKKVKTHWYDKRDKKCGWCEHASKGLPDPWNPEPPKVKQVAKKKANQQRSLTPVKFEKEGKKNQQPKRAGNAGSTPASQATGKNFLSKLKSNNNNKQPAGATPGGLPLLKDAYHPTHIDLPKHNGKTVLKYNDGRSAPRPKLGELLNANQGKLALQCFSNELPEALRFSWKINNLVPSQQGMFIGLPLGILLALTWLFTLTPLLNMLHLNKYYGGVGTIYHYFTLISVITAICGVLLTVFYGVKEVRKINHLVQYREFYHNDAQWKAIIKVAFKGLIFGPLFVIAFIFGLISFFIIAIIESDKSNKR